MSSGRGGVRVSGRRTFCGGTCSNFLSFCRGRTTSYHLTPPYLGPHYGGYRRTTGADRCILCPAQTGPVLWIAHLSVPVDVAGGDGVVSVRPSWGVATLLSVQTVHRRGP